MADLTTLLSGYINSNSTSFSENNSLSNEIYKFYYKENNSFATASFKFVTDNSTIVGICESNADINSGSYYEFASGKTQEDLLKWISLRPLDIIVIPKKDGNLDLRKELNILPKINNTVINTIQNNNGDCLLGLEISTTSNDTTTLIKSGISQNDGILTYEGTLGDSSEIVYKVDSSLYIKNINGRYIAFDSSEAFKYATLSMNTITYVATKPEDESTCVKRIFTSPIEVNEGTLQENQVVTLVKTIVNSLSLDGFESLSIYREFSPDRVISEAFTYKISDGGTLSPSEENSAGIIENYYLKFLAKNIPIKYNLTDGNLSLEAANEANKQFVLSNAAANGKTSQKGYFTNLSNVPSVLKFGKTLYIPKPVRNIEAIQNGSSYDYNFYSFLGWEVKYVKNGVTSDQIGTNVLEQGETSVARYFSLDTDGSYSTEKLNKFWTTDCDQIILTPYWFGVCSTVQPEKNNEDWTCNRYTTTNRTIYTENIPLSASGGTSEFIPLRYNDSSYTSILSGFSVELLKTFTDTNNVSYQLSIIVKFDDLIKPEFNGESNSNENSSSDVRGILARIIYIGVTTTEYTNQINETHLDYLTFLEDNSNNKYIPINFLSQRFNQLVSIKVSEDDDDIASLGIDSYPVYNVDDNWKVSLNTQRAVTDVTLVSLFDLLGYEIKTTNGETKYETYISNNDGTLVFKDDTSTRRGTTLNHDIILNNTDIYNDSYAVNNSDQVSVDWKKNGIDIGLAAPDLRNLPKFQAIGGDNGVNAFGNLFSPIRDGESGINYYKKSSYYKPEKVTDVYFIDPQIRTAASWFLFEWRTKQSKFFPSGNELSESGWFSKFVGEMFSVQEYSEDDTGNSTTTISSGSSIILSSPDSILKTTLNFSGNLNCWTRICLNPYNGKVVRLILAALLSNSINLKLNSSILNNLEDFVMPGNNNVSKFISSDKLTIDETSESVSNQTVDGSYNTDDIANELISLFSSGNEYFIYALKHTYVWVRASFAADYVDSKDFDQTLNKDSSVIHKNIILRNSLSNADFNRYKGKKSDTTPTFPYIPKNAPLKDYVSESVLEKIYENSGTEYSSSIDSSTKMAKLTGNCLEEESIIGSVLSDSVTVESKNNGTNRVGASPLVFFDPDKSNNYSGWSQRLPVIIPKDGNIYNDSRIISPTIDELWYIIKKMISGRDSDSSIADNIGSNRGVFAESFGNSPNRSNNVNHTLLEIEDNFRFQMTSGVKEGDPVDFNYTILPASGSGGEAEGTITQISVKEFFSQPDSMFYIIYNNADGNAITNRYYTGSDLSDKLLNYIEGTISGVTVNGNSFKVDNNLSGNNGWKPRSTPLTLRELEAAALGNKFNIINNFKFVKKSFTIVGPYGYSESDENSSEHNIAGSLYQLHKKFNSSTEYIENSAPNTALTRKLDNGDYDDTKAPVDIFNVANEEENLNTYDKTNKVFTNATKGVSPLPLLVENYNLSENLTTDNYDYDSKNVYMSASGDWTLENQFTRFPILRSKY